MKAEGKKGVVIGAIIGGTVIIFLVKLFFLQVVDDSFKTSADNQALRYVTQYPSRGIFYDRNGKLLAYNEAAYDLMVTPGMVDFSIDTAEFCSIVGITKERFVERLNKAKSYSRYRSSVFEKQIPADEWAVISQKLFRYPGFFGQKRALRHYPASSAAHVMGYLSEVGPVDIKNDTAYKKGDYIGVSGLEKSYESVLKGKRGVKVLMVDVHNAVKGSYKNGELDVMPIPGEDLYTTLDRDLQLYGEKLMQNKKGSIVAIEPQTGEVLALVSSPAYDPNFLVGRNRTANFLQLVRNDTLDPLFNRATKAVYRPGSIFKVVQALVALDSEVISESTRFHCNRSIIACHGSHTYDDLRGAIQHSCNPYFWNVYKRLIEKGEHRSKFKDSAHGLNIWNKYVKSFGLGVKLNSDLDGIKTGFVPDKSFYDKWYGEYRWAFSTIYSNAIGEGELGVVPIQMANFAAILANRGYYYTPHFVRGIGDGEKQEQFLEKRYTMVDSVYFEPVIDALAAVVNELGGTARRARLDSIVVCGKTGTVQNKTTPDHSAFMAFAPRVNPKIAISVYVEEAGFGGTWAAPIAGLMIEKYLTGKTDTTREKRILEADFINLEPKEE